MGAIFNKGGVFLMKGSSIVYLSNNEANEATVRISLS